MSLLKKTVLFGAVLGAVATMAIAQTKQPSPMERAIKARQAQMGLYVFNLGPLIGMAKGEVEYDAGVATRNAANLVTLSSLDLSAAWPKGSDNFDMENTRALPELWEADPAEVAAKGKALNDAVLALAEVAGNDLGALRGAIGAVGQACGACHKAYRASE